MSHTLSGFSITMFLGLGLILLVLCGIIALTTWISFRLRKVEHPKLKFLIAIAFLQILLGGLTVFVLRAIKNDPFIAIGTGLGITILSGLLFIKLIFKYGWKQSLRIWAIAAGMQLVFVPVCSVVMLVGWVMFTFMLYPPQF
jgi:hypothetical protein